MTLQRGSGWDNTQCDLLHFAARAARWWVKRENTLYYKCFDWVCLRVEDSMRPYSMRMSGKASRMFYHKTERPVST